MKCTHIKTNDGSRRHALKWLLLMAGTGIPCQNQAKEEESVSPSPWSTRHPEVAYWVLVFQKCYPDIISEITEKEDHSIIAKLRTGDEIKIEDFISESSFKNKIEAPDLMDVVSDPYPKSLDLSHWPVNFDPGRYRNDSLFKAAYGSNETEVRENLTPVEFAGNKVYFNSRNGAAEALSRVGKCLESLQEQNPELKPYLDKLGGAFAWRKIAGTERMSSHSFAIAIDLNPELGGYWRWGKPTDLSDMKRRLDYPQKIVSAFEQEKFIWGGKWYHFDLMHFEYRPEFFA